MLRGLYYATIGGTGAGRVYVVRVLPSAVIVVDEKPRVPLPTSRNEGNVKHEKRACATSSDLAVSDASKLQRATTNVQAPTSERATNAADRTHRDAYA